MKTCAGAGLLLFITFTTGAMAQRTGAEAGYPTKPIRLLVPQAPGGSNDILARSVGQYIAERIGKQVVVDNRPGADGIIGTDIIARSAPDGYSILMASAAFTQNPAVRKVPYDPVKGFDWIGKLGNGPTVLTVGQSFAVNNVKDIVALAKAKPGHITMASAGGFQHFVSALFRSLSGADFTIVLYKGGFPAMIDVMGGQANLTIGSIVQSIPHIRSGKLRGIATGSLKRAATLPDLPTIAESGVPGYDAGNWWALAVPAGVPAPILDRLNAHIASWVKTPETQKRFANEGAEADIMRSEALRKFIPADIAKWVKVAKDAGMKPE
ncbi:MAG TPA: tripartite tricarboxylate transporter substrate binding protein [Burkholderiales bacterium]|nr:tripartite tricarboxylate transporter substrate binding protein [Burkholderiales bacterium]